VGGLRLENLLQSVSTWYKKTVKETGKIVSGKFGRGGLLVDMVMMLKVTDRQTSVFSFGI